MGSNGNKKPSRMSSQHPPVNLPPQNFLGTASHVLLLSHCMPRAWSLFLTTLPSPVPPHPTGIQQQLREPRIREGGADGSRERERQNCHHCSIQGKPRGTSLLVSTAGIPRQLTEVPLMYFSSSALFCCRCGVSSAINLCRVGGGGAGICKALGKS